LPVDLGERREPALYYLGGGGGALNRKDTIKLAGKGKKVTTDEEEVPPLQEAGVNTWGSKSHTTERGTELANFRKKRDRGQDKSWGAHSSATAPGGGRRFALRDGSTRFPRGQRDGKLTKRLRLQKGGKENEGEYGPETTTVNRKR